MPEVDLEKLKSTILMLSPEEKKELQAALRSNNPAKQIRSLVRAGRGNTKFLEAILAETVKAATEYGVKENAKALRRSRRRRRSR
jgi:hypothetical protein